MLDYKSLAFYHDLKKLFAKDNERIRKILLSDFFDNNELKIMQATLNQYDVIFSDNFFACLNIGKKKFVSSEFEAILKELYSELEEIYEEKKCTIITASEISANERFRLEEKLHEKFGNLRFVYEIREEIKAGVVLKIGNCYYDGSLRQMLLDIKMNIQKEVKYGKF